MSANKENNLVQAYIELNKFCQNADYDRALKAAGKVLQIAPNEQKAFHCKVVCFLQLHNFKEALAVLTNSKNAALSADLHFEKAYAQYRLNNPKDALQTVDNAPELTPALKELRAQILYRLEQYQDCYNFYRDIVKNTNDDYEDERKANMSAVVANLAELNPAGEYPQFDETTYELIYNAGSTLAMRGKYNEALPVLKRAEQKCCESVIDDGGTEEEAKEEGAIIRAQQAYCLQQMGKEKEAAAIYHNILKDKPSDQALAAIASNNLVVINRDGNVFDSRKRMKTATQDGLEHKLNTRQRANITYNQAILSIYSNQPEFCKQCCVKLVREFNQPARAACVEASSLLKEGALAAAAALLLRAGPPLELAAVQLTRQQGDAGLAPALALLQQSAWRHRAGVLALRRALLQQSAGPEAVSDMFADACQHYADRPMEPSLRAVWSAAAEAHARAGRAELAAAAVEAQGSGGAGGRRARARLVRALARLQPARAHALAAKLPAPAAQGEIEVDALESSNWMMGAKVVKKNVSKQEQSPGTPAPETLKRKQKRKRKCKLPPNADLSRAPDPERWLPRHERAAFRRRRARREQLRGSQGLGGAAADAYDMTRQPPPAPAPAGRSPRPDKPGDSAWQRKQQQKKKGKKKW